MYASCTKEKSQELAVRGLMVVYIRACRLVGLDAKALETTTSVAWHGMRRNAMINQLASCILRVGGMGKATSGQSACYCAPCESNLTAL